MLQWPRITNCATVTADSTPMKADKRTVPTRRLNRSVLIYMNYGPHTPKETGMPMPPNPSSETSKWWSKFHFDYGMDSEEERQFQGYLFTHGLQATKLTPEQLSQHWDACRTFVQTS